MVRDPPLVWIDAIASFCFGMRDHIALEPEKPYREGVHQAIHVEDGAGLEVPLDNVRVGRGALDVLALGKGGPELRKVLQLDDLHSIRRNLDLPDFAIWLSSWQTPLEGLNPHHVLLVLCDV